MIYAFIDKNSFDMAPETFVIEAMDLYAAVKEFNDESMGDYNSDRYQVYTLTEVGEVHIETVKTAVVY